MTDWLWDSLRWNDLLDVGILAFLLYRMLVILRGTRAVQALVGLGILLGVYVASDRLHLNSVHWVLDKFIAYLFFAVIVLFQQDIRRGLARAGGRRSARHDVTGPARHHRPVRRQPRDLPSATLTLSHSRAEEQGAISLPNISADVRGSVARHLNSDVPVLYSPGHRACALIAANSCVR